MKVSRSGGGTLISDEALDQNRRSQVLHQYRRRSLKTPNHRAYHCR
jgi:hypothetical protein